MFRAFNILYFRILSLLLVVVVFPVIQVSAQAEKHYIRKGNREYEKNKYADSEILYRKADDKNSESPDIMFNIGDALYKQKKYEEAGKEFADHINRNEEKVKKAAGLYNLGNSLLMANKLEESINAYKNSLKLNPGSPEAKYNLGYAQSLLKQQQQQQQQQQQNKDNKDNKDQKQDQDKDQDKNKQDQQDKNQAQDQKNPQDQQQQQQQQQISKEDAERLLNALANDEKDVQEKVKREKAARAKVRTLKNW